MPVMKAARGAGAVSEAIDSDHGPVALVRAVIATGIGRGVIDHDGDGYDPGAFGAGHKVILSGWNHSSVSAGEPPIGAGTIREVGTDAIFTGELWLAMQAARDVHHVLRLRGGAQEWSYVLNVTKSRPARAGEPKGRYIQALEAIEAGPVWRGAGVGTRTLSVVAGDLDAATRAELQRIGDAVTGGSKQDRAVLEQIRLRMIERVSRARMAGRA